MNRKLRDRPMEEGKKRKENLLSGRNLRDLRRVSLMAPIAETFRSSISLATPLINSHTRGGRKGFPYLRQRFCSHDYLRASFAYIRYFSPRASCAHLFLSSSPSLSFDDCARVYCVLAYCTFTRAGVLKPDLHDSLFTEKNVCC